MARTRKNERKIESILEDALKSKGFSADEIEHQGSDDPLVRDALPSKTGGSGQGRPEFILHVPGSSILVVVEVKDGTNLHTCLKAEDDPNTATLSAEGYAEDGVIHYMRALREHYDVVGLAVSGDGPSHPDDLRITCFRALKHAPVERVKFKGVPDPKKCRSIIEDGLPAKALSDEGIRKFASSLHNFLRDEMELSKDEKPLLVSALMLALQSDVRNTYYKISDPEHLAESVLSGIKSYLKTVKMPVEKSESMMMAYRLISENADVVRHLSRALATVDRSLGGYVRSGGISRDSFDIMGHFYREFLRYTGGDKQHLGIVLTPQHICELYAEMATLDPKSSVVLDTCTGTAGFPVAAMANMILQADGDPELEKRIKSRGLIGIEKRPSLFTVACANMILRGDGKANMFQGDCITDDEIFKKVRALQPNVAIINPPYSKEKQDLHEYAFILRALEMLEPGGTLITVVPMRLAVALDAVHEEWKRRILSGHTLDAVMSMPDDLFPGVGVVTCTMVFTAKQPHARSKRETWFGYWKDDGFRLLKGDRIEKSEGAWTRTMDSWLDMYRNRRILPGKSSTALVDEKSEWCAEAYLEPDFSTLSETSFVAALRSYALHKLYVDSINATN